MSKLTSPSVSDSFNAPGKGPHHPGTINWSQVGVMVLIAISGAAVFGLIIHWSNSSIANKLIAVNERMMKSLQDGGNTKLNEVKPASRQEENQLPKLVDTNNATKT